MSEKKVYFWEKWRKGEWIALIVIVALVWAMLALGFADIAKKAFWGWFHEVMAAIIIGLAVVGWFVLRNKDRRQV